VSYKVYMWGSLSGVEWSQAGWKAEGRIVPLHYCTEERLHGVLMAHVPKQGITVDAGCGTGRWPLYLQRLGYRAVGVEIDHDGCVIAKENQHDLPMLQADIMRLPFRDQSVDALLSLGVVEHNEPGPTEALREAHRVLKPGAVLILAVPYNNLFRRLIVNRAQSYVTRRRRRAGMQLTFSEYRFNRSEVRVFLQRCGFETVAVYPNDLAAPKHVGLWVDYSNIFANPLAPPSEDPFRLPGIQGQIADRVLRWFPWLVCAEIVFVARAL
jgi:SAM-dependent methyltransferase